MSVDAELIQIRMRLEGGKEVEVDAKAAAKALGAVGKEVETAGKRSEVAATSFEKSMKRIGDWGEKTRRKGRSMTLGLTLPIAGIGAYAIHAAGDFERSMAQVAVATEAPEKKIAQLGELAKELGADTKFSAGESAEAMLELAKSGMSPAQIEAGGLKAAMDLAAAGNVGLADAASLSARSMNSFHLKAKEAGSIADALAGGDQAATTSVAALGEALSQGGTSAAIYGLSLQEAVGTLAAFSEHSLNGSDAGTSFKTFLMRLNPTSKKAADEINRLGLSFFDAHGNMKSLGDIAGELKGKLGDLTSQERGKALGTIFGSDAFRAASALYSEGAKGVNEYIAATEKQGIAQQYADAFMEGSAGKIEEARGAMDNAAIAAGVALAPAVIFLAEAAGDLFDVFADLPEPVQQFIAGGLALVALAGPLLWFIGSMAVAAEALGVSLAALGVAFGIGAAILALGAAFVLAYHKVGWFHDAVDAVADFITGWLIPGFKEIGEWAVTGFDLAKGAAEDLWHFVTTNPIGKILTGQFQLAYIAVKHLTESVTWLMERLEDALSIYERIEGALPGTGDGGGIHLPGGVPLWDEAGELWDNITGGGGDSSTPPSPKNAPRSRTPKDGGHKGRGRAARASGLKQPIVVQTFLDGVQVAENTAQHADDAAALA